MRERPILMSGPMVRAILDGRKTQTRRIVKLGRFDAVRDGYPYDCARHTLGRPMPCPYGVPGDRLWVREMFSYSAALPVSMRKGPASQRHIWYWADGNPEHGDWTRPKPSIHMPRWASRLTLEVTGVRVERVQDISEADAIAEGAAGYLRGWHPRPAEPNGGGRWPVREEFESLWCNINGERSWQENPWVWVVEFRKVPHD